MADRPARSRSPGTPRTSTAPSLNPAGLLARKLGRRRSPSRAPAPTSSTCGRSARRTPVHLVYHGLNPDFARLVADGPCVAGAATRGSASSASGGMVAKKGFDVARRRRRARCATGASTSSWCSPARTGRPAPTVDVLIDAARPRRRRSSVIGPLDQAGCWRCYRRRRLRPGLSRRRRRRPRRHPQRARRGDGGRRGRSCRRGCPASPSWSRRRSTGCSCRPRTRARWPRRCAASPPTTRSAPRDSAAAGRATVVATLRRRRAGAQLAALLPMTPVSQRSAVGVAAPGAVRRSTSCAATSRWPTPPSPAGSPTRRHARPRPRARLARGGLAARRRVARSSG